MECQKYTNKLRKDTTTDVLGDSDVVYRVFFSPQLNSCLAARYKLYSKKGGGDSEKLYVQDILADKEVWASYYDEAVLYPVAERALDDAIKTANLESE